jgi:peptidyl-tRNA hydrolase, PTH1 family
MNTILAGLGNPGEQYALTRHNIGFLFVDYVATKLEVDATDWRFLKKHQAEVVTLPDRSLILAKPQTFMNLSGESLSSLCRFYETEAARVFVAYDDIDLPFGTVRFRDSGSSGGHKGMQSVIDHLGDGSTEIPRVRFGINHEKREIPTDAFVLQRFSQEELTALPEIFAQAFEEMSDRLLA